MPKKAAETETPVVYETEEELHIQTDEEYEAQLAHLDEEGDRAGDPEADEITEAPSEVSNG